MLHRSPGLTVLLILSVGAGGLAALDPGDPALPADRSEGGPPSVEAPAGPRAGTISPLADSWRSTSLGARFQDPVVLAGPPTHEGPHPGVLRLRNVSSGSFEARFREWRYRRADHDDDSHRDEAAPYLVLESGRTQMPDGSVWLAGTFELDGTKSWTEVTFPGALPGEPTLLLTPQTANGPHPVSVRARNVTARGFAAALFEEEALGGGHRTETVGYLAIYGPEGEGRAEINGRSADYRLTSVSLSDQWRRVGPARLHLEEESSRDGETGHTSERVDVLVLGSSASPRVFAQQVTSRGGDPTALRSTRSTAAAGGEGGAAGWHLAKGAPSYSKVAGASPGRTRRLDLVDRPMTGLDVAEKANRPCYVRVFNIGPEGFDARSVSCLKEGAGGESVRIRLNGKAVRGLSVCTNNRGQPFQTANRVKGVALQGTRILEDGSLGKADASDQYSMANCNGSFANERATGEWEPMIRCGPRKVATGVIAHLAVLAGGDKHDLRGLQLICRRVVRGSQ